MRATTLIGQNEFDVSKELAQTILERQSKESHLRPFNAMDIEYREILGPWEVRGGIDLGLLGVALAEHFLVQPSLATQIQIVFFAAIAVLRIHQNFR